MLEADKHGIRLGPQPLLVHELVPHLGRADLEDTVIGMVGGRGDGSIGPDAGIQDSVDEMGADDLLLEKTRVAVLPVGAIVQVQPLAMLPQQSSARVRRPDDRRQIIDRINVDVPKRRLGQLGD